ncbi:MAG: 3-dehydroquinate synthase, partial [Spirochaetaceae bacterium]|nr:3-dehydroquinate synthase [Spirochaetaceae bacterium]
MQEFIHTSSRIVFAPFEALQDHVQPQHAIVLTTPLVRRLAGHHLDKWRIIEVPDGEACKTLEVYASVCEAMLDAGADRATILVAVGGGSVSDLVGFVAHTWMRGIRLAVVPTTLLSMIDASLGGKNAMDFRGTKNLLGSLHFPELVLCDVDWIRSLPESALAAGMAEAIKHAVIDGEDHLEELRTLAMRAERYGLGAAAGLALLASDILESCIRRSQEVKLRIVSSDPHDRETRHLLNFGHTVGHALELAAGIPHGHAVAVGMCMTLQMAVEDGVMDAAAAHDIITLIARFALPV